MLNSRGVADAAPPTIKQLAVNDARATDEQTSSGGSSGDEAKSHERNLDERVSSLHGAGLQANAEGDSQRAHECFMAAYRLRPNGAAHVLSAANMKLKIAHMAHWDAYRVAQQAAGNSGKKVVAKELWHAGSTRERKAYMESWELYQEAAALPLTKKQQEMVREKLAEIQRAVE